MKKNGPIFFNNPSLGDSHMCDKSTNKFKNNRWNRFWEILDASLKNLFSRKTARRSKGLTFSTFYLHICAMYALNWIYAKKNKVDFLKPLHGMIP